eukprot:NODE_183_length_13752_cov_1.079103.p10 type:complete len:136 gc:universal NODE_183_length_13752_cov_1.079103:3324-3731(+)
MELPSFYFSFSIHDSRKIRPQTPQLAICLAINHFQNLPAVNTKQMTSSRIPLHPNDHLQVHKDLVTYFLIVLSVSCTNESSNRAILFLNKAALDPYLRMSEFHSMVPSWQIPLSIVSKSCFKDLLVLQTHVGSFD